MELLSEARSFPVAICAGCFAVASLLSSGADACTTGACIVFVEEACMPAFLDCCG